MLITCRDLNDTLTDYLDGAMSPWERFKFRLHMVLCPECKLHVDKMRQLVDVLGEIPPDTAAPPEMLERFRAWSGQLS